VNDVIATARSFVGTREETQNFLSWASEVEDVHNLLNKNALAAAGATRRW